jgi:hypothetical membrane protein
MKALSVSDRLLFGPLAGILLVFGVGGLALMVPGYSHAHQTVSEIGEVGSPARVPFAILLSCVAICLLVFASAVRDVAAQIGRPRVAAYLIGFMGVATAGVGVFSYPHPFHNVFGLSELVGYQAPLVLALTWRPHPRTKILVRFSWVMTALVWLAIALNLSVLDRQGALWALVKPEYGLVQRALFASWFGWCGGVGILSSERRRA